MSEQTENAVNQPTDLTHQADEVSGRPSVGEMPPQGDRLTEKNEAFSSGNSYDKLTLPENLKGQEENFAAFKTTNHKQLKYIYCHLKSQGVICQ